MLESILTKYPKEQDMLIEILLDVQNQKTDQYLSEAEIEQIASYLSLPTAHVSSAVSFYTFFSTQPRGKHVIQVCKDVPCYLNDSDNLVDTIQKQLGIGMHETTEDGMFTLEPTSCLGICDGAPAMRIGEHTYTKLNKDRVTALLAEYRGKR